jgi:hypothetical protein
VPAGAPAGDLLDKGPGVGGQLGSIVDDPELGVADRHGDDLAAVSVADLEFDSGDHEAALAGDHPADVVTAAGRAVGGGPASRAPCSRPRAAGGSGLGRVRAPVS